MASSRASRIRGTASCSACSGIPNTTSPKPIAASSPASSPLRAAEAVLRIIAGKHRGRKLTSLPGKDVRPTGGRAREALFNILEHAHFNPRPVFEDAVVLDAFAGTGAL